MVNRDKTVQQLKSEALEIAGTIADVSELIPPVTKKVKGLAGLLKKVVQDEASVSSRPSTLSHPESVEKEMNYYFDLPAANTESDPLHWWSSERKHFSILALLAQKYLCICGSSVPSECTFDLISESSFSDQCWEIFLQPNPSACPPVLCYNMLQYSGKLNIRNLLSLCPVLSWWTFLD